MFQKDQVRKGSGGGRKGGTEEQERHETYRKQNAGINPTISVIILNISWLNTSTKTEIVR